MLIMPVSQISNNNKERLVDQHKLLNQQLAVTPVLRVNNYTITYHIVNY